MVKAGGAQSIAVLIGFLALSLGVGVLAGQVTELNVANWYPRLIKPAFNPPNWLFAPVWTALYILIAIAAWRVWCIQDFSSRALLLWIVQLALNFAWSFIFFGAHQIGFALIEISILWLAVLMTTLAFFRVDRVAGLLFVPYMLWLSFAAALNGAIYQLNPGWY